MSWKLASTEFNYLRSKPNHELSTRRNRLIGRLRQLVARAAVDHLEPDLVILDEFQRFKDLLDADDEGAELAHAIFDHPDAKVCCFRRRPTRCTRCPTSQRATITTATSSAQCGSSPATSARTSSSANCARCARVCCSGGDHARAR